MDAAGNPIPFPELTDDWLSGPERRLRTQIRRERRENRVRLDTARRNPPERGVLPLPLQQRELREPPPTAPLPCVEREREQQQELLLMTLRFRSKIRAALRTSTTMMTPRLFLQK
jgi:hypothetical protein